MVANDAVAIIVNESNPLSKISLKDVERVFTGDVTNWSAVGGKSGGISTYTRNTSSGTYAFFQKFALAGRDYGSATQKMVETNRLQRKFPRTQMELVISVWPMLVRQESR